jgi:coenzyme F420-dependent glucose-6-phosphate dehydrogenase
LPARPPLLHIAASAKLSAALAGRIGDGMIGVTPDARLVEVFQAAGGADKPCLAQLHVSIAETVDAAMDNAWEWWPHGVVPPAVLGEQARPQDFEAIAEAIGRDRIGDTVVCATDAAPVVAAVDRFVGAGFDTVYLHQIGPDQQRLAAMARDELLPHYAAVL